MKKIASLFSFILVISIISCENKAEIAIKSSFQHTLSFSPGQEDAIRTTLITIKDNSSVLLKAGVYHFEKLTILGKLQNIELKGEGPDKTIIDFANQAGGGEGMHSRDFI